MAGTPTSILAGQTTPDITIAMIPTGVITGRVHDDARPARGVWVEVLACPGCGDRLELIALIEDPSVIRRILSHLGLPTDVPAARPARPPPLPMGRPDTWYDDDLAAP